ncbi:MAG: hypothetical protein HGA54_04280, partial [Actinobacteria bacterium]|nr:hypothetical protein [Actinomycetota bacterium]
AIIGSGSERDALLDVVHKSYRPNLIVAASEDGKGTDIPLLAEREMLDGHATAYVCRAFSCERPVTDPRDLETLIDAGITHV